MDDDGSGYADDCVYGDGTFGKFEAGEMPEGGGLHVVVFVL